MKCYKGFDKDMKCRGFQYKEGETYETDDAKLCESGFHACEYSLDCFRYYAPNESQYCEVDLEATDEKENDDTKRVGKRIKIGAKLSIHKIVEASVEYIKEHIDSVKTESNTGEWSAATNTGEWSAATNTGYRSAATNTGDRSAATNTGDWSAATNTGDGSAATNTGYGGVAIVTGYKSKAKGAIGSAICVCERGDWDGKDYPLLAIKAAIINGETLKPDTWYTLKDGEFVEVGEDE